MQQAGLFGLSDHREALGKHGDPLEVLDGVVDFEFLRGWLVDGLGYGDGARGGRPPFDPVSMFKALILQAPHNLSDARMAFMIRTIGLAHAKAKLTLANLAYNFDRLIFHERRQPTG